MKISASGDVEFTDDESDVKSISSGGWFVVDRRVGGIGGFFASDAKRFEARERNGAVERKFFVDGRELGADEGRKWLATFLPEMLRNMAVNADRRVARQLAKGGPALVLDRDRQDRQSRLPRASTCVSSTSRRSWTRRR